MSYCSFCQDELANGEEYRIVLSDTKEITFCTECASDMVKYIRSFDEQNYNVDNGLATFSQALTQFKTLTVKLHRDADEEIMGKNLRKVGQSALIAGKNGRKFVKAIRTRGMRYT